MQQFKEIISIIPLLTLFGFSVTFLKVIVNAINANEIDNLLKSPWKKFIDFFAISNLISLITVSMIISELYTDELKAEIIKYPGDFLLLLLILYMLLTFILIMLGYLFINLTKLLWNTKDYYIVDSNGEEWKVEKAIDNNRIYIVKENLTKILDIDNSYSIKKVIIPNKKLQKVFDLIDKIKYFKYISLTIFFALVIGFGSLFFVEFNNRITIGIILLLIIALLVIIVQGYNDYLFNTESNTKSEEINNVDNGGGINI